MSSIVFDCFINENLRVVDDSFAKSRDKMKKKDVLY
jgi:hypothetical protein